MGHDVSGVKRKPDMRIFGVPNALSWSIDGTRDWGTLASAYRQVIQVQQVRNKWTTSLKVFTVFVVAHASIQKSCLIVHSKTALLLSCNGF